MHASHPSSPDLHPPEPAWRRCFLGLVPDASTREALTRLPLPPAVAAVPPADLHLTLAFLGAITAPQGQALIQALPTLACALPPLPPLSQQQWPSTQSPRFTVQCYALLPALQAVHALTQTLLRTLDLPVEARPFRPHITLGRWQGAPVDSATAHLPGPAHFTAVAVYTSIDASAPAHYRILAQHPLRQRATPR